MTEHRTHNPSASADIETVSPPGEPAPTQRLLAFGLLGLLAIFWGVNWPIMKVGLQEVPPWVFRGSASAVSAAGLFLIARLGGHGLSVPRREWRVLALAGVLNLGCFNIFVLYGIDLMDAGRAGILAYTMPLWATVIGAVVLRERIGVQAGLGLCLGLAAMGLLFWEDIAVLSRSVLGPALVVLAALCWGAGTVVIKYARLSTPITVAVAWQHVIGGSPILIVALVYDLQNLESVSLWPGLAVVYNMTVTGILCYWAYFKVVTLLPVVASTVGTLAVPVIGVFANAWIFSTTPSPLDYVALAGVGAAIALVMTRRVQSPGRPASHSVD